LRKKFGPEGAKDVLCGAENCLVVRAASGNIEQAKQYALLTHAQGIIKISRHAFPVRSRGNFRTDNLRELARGGLQGGRGLGCTRTK
jgi:hypothetical protein